MTSCGRWSPIVSALAMAAAACSSSVTNDSVPSTGGTASGTNGAAASGEPLASGGTQGSGGKQTTGGTPGTGSGPLGSGGSQFGSGGADPNGDIDHAGGVGVSGGASSSGGLVGSGGAAVGGAASGAAVSGGRSWGGGASGGAEADGGATGAGAGGAGTGGSAMGGRGSGGSATGGAGSGGSVAGGPGGGGSAAGGPGTGGSATGGAATGGSGIGGAPNAAGSSGAASDSGGAGDAEPSSGCGHTPTLTSGKHSIQSSGQSRSFILSIPDDYDASRPHRLIFAFHWNGGTSEDIDGGGTSGAVWSYYGLRAQANDTTIFVAPQGNGNGWANPNGQDLTFVDDMVSLIEEDLCVDTTRLFALGFSYGGGMSYAIACARPTVFRAVAVYSGARLSGCDGGTTPVAYLGVHGIGDPTCDIDGGHSLRDTFVRNNGCVAQNPPEPSAGSLTHTCTTYEGCEADHPVEWCAFDGGHTPGMVDGGGDDGARTWTKEVAWSFFTQF